MSTWVVSRRECLAGLFSGMLAWGGAGLGIALADPPAGEGAAPTTAAPQKYRLAYRFVPGERVTYSIQHDSRIASTANSRQEVALNNPRTVRSYRVLEVAITGEAKLELQIDSVWMSSQFEDADGEKSPAVVFDSTQPAGENPPPQFSVVRENVGRPQSIVTMDPQGRMLTARRLNVREGEPAEVDPRQRMESFLLTLPTEEVAVGGSWRDPMDVPVRTEGKLMTKVRLQTTYTLEKVEGSEAHVSYKTVVLTPLEDPRVVAQLMQREMTGRFVFDLEGGRVVTREAKLDRSVVGAFGAQSNLKATAEYSEKLVPVTTAARETTSAVE